jgi:hypothetical protein
LWGIKRVLPKMATPSNYPQIRAKECSHFLYKKRVGNNKNNH